MWSSKVWPAQNQTHACEWSVFSVSFFDVSQASHKQYGVSNAPVKCKLPHRIHRTRFEIWFEHQITGAVCMVGWAPPLRRVSLQRLEIGWSPGTKLTASVSCKALLSGSRLWLSYRLLSLPYILYIRSISAYLSFQPSLVDFMRFCLKIRGSVVKSIGFILNWILSKRLLLTMLDHHPALRLHVLLSAW